MYFSQDRKLKARFLGRRFKLRPKNNLPKGRGFKPFLFGKIGWVVPRHVTKREFWEK
jgi:hypothetical protein